MFDKVESGLTNLTVSPQKVTCSQLLILYHLCKRTAGIHPITLSKTYTISGLLSEENNMDVIDSHIHFWDPSRSSDILVYDNFPTLRRKIELDHFLSHFKAFSIKKVILVQADQVSTIPIILMILPDPMILSTLLSVGVTHSALGIQKRLIPSQPSTSGFALCSTECPSNRQQTAAQTLCAMLPVRKN